MRGKNRLIQFLRGISIIAVVLTHSLGKAGIFPLVMKPWLCFQVMLFVFLSGYLTPREKVQDVWKFYRRRLVKVLIPYAVWTAVYLLLDGNFTLYQFVRAIIRANAWGPLYYLHDYAQLVVLTPLLYRMLQKKSLRIALYAVSPLYIVFNYYMNIHDRYLLVPVCLWLILPYVIGLEHGYWREKIKVLPVKKALIPVVIFVVAQAAESFIWRYFGVEALANTQVKFTSLGYFLAVLFLIACLNEKQREKLSKIRPITLVGDLSFGIYCCHGVFLILISGFIPKQFPYSITLWIVVTGLSVALVKAGSYLPLRIRQVLGFV